MVCWLVWLSEQIHSLAFDDVANEIKCSVVYSHPNEIWHMSTSASHTNKFWTVHHNRTDWGVTLWQMGDKATSDVLTAPSDLGNTIPYHIYHFY
jgi:hypothetical protein